MYKYIKLMSRYEFKALMVNYGNNTGAEVNNSVIRDLFEMVCNNIAHPVLIKLNTMIENSGRNELISKISHFLECDESDFNDDELYLFIREERNRLGMLQAIELDRSFFMGCCAIHGVTGFLARRFQEYPKYTCQQCNEDGGNNIFYNPERNIIFRAFVNKYQFNKKELRFHTEITSFAIPEITSLNKKIHCKKWALLSEFIINKTGKE